MILLGEDAWCEEGGEWEDKWVYFRRYGHVERIDGSGLLKRMDAGENVRNRTAGRPKKKWIESDKYQMKKTVHVVQARKMVDINRVNGRDLREYGCGSSSGGEPLNYEISQ